MNETLEELVMQRFREAFGMNMTNSEMVLLESMKEIARSYDLLRADFDRHLQNAHHPMLR